MQQQQPPPSIKLVLLAGPRWVIVMVMGAAPRVSAELSLAQEPQGPTLSPGGLSWERPLPGDAGSVPGGGCAGQTTAPRSTCPAQGTANKEQAFDVAKFSICSRDL